MPRYRWCIKLVGGDAVVEEVSSPDPDGFVGRFSFYSGVMRCQLRWNHLVNASHTSMASLNFWKLCLPVTVLLATVANALKLGSCSIRMLSPDQ